MKRTFGVVLAILCMFTLSFSGVFASQTNGTSDKVYEIKASVEHGTITPTNAKVAAGSNQTVSYSADKGYQLKTITVDDKAQDIKKNTNKYTFEKVSANHAIKVAYEKMPALSYEKVANKASAKSGDKVTYTIKVSQTAKDAEARDVVLTDTLSEGFTVDKDSIKGDVTTIEAKDNVCSVGIASLKDSVTYSYTATASKDMAKDDILGKMKMSAGNMKSTSGTSTVIEQSAAPKSGATDQQNSQDSQNSQNQNEQNNQSQPGNNSDDNSGNNSGNNSGDNPAGQPTTTKAKVTLTNVVSNATPKKGDTIKYTITVGKPDGATSVNNAVVSVSFPEGIKSSGMPKITGDAGTVATATSSAVSDEAGDRVTGSKFNVSIPELKEGAVITVDATVAAEKGTVETKATFTGDNAESTEAVATFTVKEAEQTPSQSEDQNQNQNDNKYSLSDKVYVAEYGEYWHYDLNCSRLNNANKDKIDTMTLEQAKKTENRGKTNTTGHTYLIECPDCAKGSTEATGGAYEGDTTLVKPEFKKSADKKEVALSGTVKYTVTASVKDGKVTGVTVKDNLPSGMELVKDSVKASDKGSVTTKDNVITVTYKNIEKKTVTITYEAKATKEGDQKNVATMTYTNAEAKNQNSELKAETTVKVTSSTGDSEKVDRAAYKTGDFIPYIVGAVLLALLIAAYVVYRRRKNDGDITE